MTVFFGSLSDLLFFWLKVFIPLMFIARLSKKEMPYLNMFVLVQSVNTLILLAGLSCLLFYLTLFFKYWLLPDGGYEQYANINRLTGSYWYAYLMPVFIYVLSPQIMWFRKIRKSVNCSYSWNILAISYSGFIYLMCNDFFSKRDYIPSSYPLFSKPIGHYLITFLVFLLIISTTYIVILKPMKK